MKRNTTEYDVLLAVIWLLGIVVWSPKVIRQFTGLHKTGDIIWNVSYDLMLLLAVTVGFLLLDGFLNYLKRKFK